MAQVVECALGDLRLEPSAVFVARGITFLSQHIAYNTPLFFTINSSIYETDFIVNPIGAF